MDKSKPKLQTIFENVFTGAIDELLRSHNGQLVNALLVQLDMETGELLVYDNNESLLEKNMIYDWAEQSAKNPRLYRQAVHFMRVALSALKARKLFDNSKFARPFKVLIVDEMLNEIETVFTLEGADGLSEGKLMKHLEQDLQIFYKKIFANL